MRTLYTINCEDLGSLSDMLAAMEAAAALKPDMKAYAKCDPKYARLIKSAWFIKGVLDPDADESAYDVVCEPVSDIESCKNAEFDYRAEQKKIVDEAIEKYAEENNIAADTVKRPAHYDILCSNKPIWDRAMSYQLKIREECCFEKDLPLVGVPNPHMPVAGWAKDLANKFLHAQRKEIIPGVPFILASDPELFKSHGLANFLKPDGWQIIWVNEAQLNPGLLVGLIRHPLCKAVFSKVGGLSHAAWALGTGMIVEITEDPHTAYWAAVRTQNATLVDLTSEKTDPKSFNETLRVFYQYCYTIELE